MSSVITNRMDRPWTFVAPGWAFSFTLKPLEMRVLSDEEAKAVSANPSVARLVDSGLLAMDTPKKDAEAVNTVAQTQKRVKDAEKSGPDRAVRQQGRDREDGNQGHVLCARKIGEA
ncbi:MAG: hypothetical protein ACLR7Z_17305 [Bilophila wadsworthia]